MYKEDTEGIELIKDYLRLNGYKGTLECFESEDKYKNVGVEQKKVKESIPITSEKYSKLHKLIQDSKETNKNYLKLQELYKVIEKKDRKSVV